MLVNEKMGKCKTFAFALVPGHVYKEILKLNGIILKNRINVMEGVTSARKRNDKKFAKSF